MIGSDRPPRPNHRHYRPPLPAAGVLRCYPPRPPAECEHEHTTLTTRTQHEHTTLTTRTQHEHTTLTTQSQHEHTTLTTRTLAFATRALVRPHPHARVHTFH
ncbi:unnamed protein product, partial [Laminaria digitata]